FGSNEADLQWPGEREWEYRLLFDRPEGFPEDDDIHLVFQGLDTYASAWLNGEEILKADNMFVEWETDVSNLLKDHDNELLLRFSPVHSMDSLRISRAGLDPVTDYAVHRKAAYHFGWDWGPRFLTMGIWQDVFLESRPQARIADVFIRQDSVSKDVAVLSALIDLEGALSAVGRLVAVVNGKEWKIDVPEGDLHDIVLEMRLEQPMLWYPRGMGQQHLTAFSFSLVMDDEVLHEHEVITGLRRLELNQEPDSCGRSFAFSVNGQAVFARGANLIPLDMFPSRVEPEEYEALLHLAANAGVNMLRIWGGGIYEKEQLYDLCDRLGILIWQDFMFACSMYPADSHFMNSVALEAGQQVRRLRNHPSIAIWCGNNENWVGWNNWGWQEKYSAPERVKAELDYASLFDSLLPGVVARYDPGKSYWPSSPLHNWAREDVWDGGDLHY
ncbi:MAG: glycoside hydrolase family 2 protein, partial [Bacteroidales bacterium]|nr:glycoside hydrolase family 2 protein [Bacteroidales bacterium]